MKHRRMRQVIVTSENGTRCDHPDGRLGLEHRSDLYRRCMGSQQSAVFEIEGILHISCRMVLGKIQCFEVMKIIFDHRSGLDREIQGDKIVYDPVHRLHHRVQCTFLCQLSIQRNIDRLAFEHLFDLFGLQCFIVCIEYLLQGRFLLVQAFCKGFLLRSGDLFHPGELRRKHPFFTEQFYTYFFQIFKTVSLNDLLF